MTRACCAKIVLQLRLRLEKIWSWDVEALLWLRHFLSLTPQQLGKRGYLGPRLHVSPQMIDTS
eukprot:scaffold29773_cov22-Tisochrysis_lutea.AAC.2